MCTILIADDKPIHRQFLKTLLGYGGHTVPEADNGEQALELARQYQPDLIISDILMPEMDGFEFVRRLREEPSVNQIPVIFFTAAYMEREARALAEKSTMRKGEAY